MQAFEQEWKKVTSLGRSLETIWNLKLGKLSDVLT